MPSGGALVIKRVNQSDPANLDRRSWRDGPDLYRSCETAGAGHVYRSARREMARAIGASQEGCL